MPIADFTKERGFAIRKYFVEFVVIALVACVGYLFNLYVGMNKFITEELIKSNLEQRLVIERNTIVLQTLTNNSK